MNEAQIEQFIGGQIWWIIGLASLFLVRNLIESAIQSLLLFFGSDFDADNIVFLGDERTPSRIIRIGLWKTTFFCYDVKVDEYTGKAFISGGCKRVVQNSQLATLKIDKPLENIDLSTYDRPMKDPDCRRENGKRYEDRRRQNDE